MDVARVNYSRFDVWLVNLEPVKGREIKKTRPCIIISPNEINDNMQTVLIAPLTSTITSFPFRLNCDFQQHQGQVALDHIRSVDKIRLVKKLGEIEDTTAMNLCQLLHVLFEY